MSLSRAIVVAVMAFGVVACSAPKAAGLSSKSSALTYEQHLLMGEGLIMGHRCAAAGFMDVSSASSLRSYSQKVLENSYYLQNLLDEGIAKAEAKSIEKAYCVNLAMVVTDTKINATNKRQEALDQQSRNTKEMYNAGKAFTDTMPKQTICNRVGTQMFCSTY